MKLETKEQREALTPFQRAFRRLCNPATPEAEKDAIEAELTERWEAVRQGKVRYREPGED